MGSVFKTLHNGVYLGEGVRNRATKAIYNTSNGAGDPIPSRVTLEDLAKEKPKAKKRPQSEWIVRPQPHLKEFLPENIRPQAKAAIDLFDQKRSEAKPVTLDKNRHLRTSDYLFSKHMRSKQGAQLMTGRTTTKKDGSAYRRYAVNRGNGVPKTGNSLGGLPDNP